MERCIRQTGCSSVGSTNQAHMRIRESKQNSTFSEIRTALSPSPFGYARVAHDQRSVPLLCRIEAIDPENQKVIRP